MKVEDWGRDRPLISKKAICLRHPQLTYIWYWKHENADGDIPRNIIIFPYSTLSRRQLMTRDITCTNLCRWRDILIALRLNALQWSPWVKWFQFLHVRTTFGYPKTRHSAVRDRCGSQSIPEEYVAKRSAVIWSWINVVGGVDIDLSYMWTQNYCVCREMHSILVSGGPEIERNLCTSTCSVHFIPSSPFDLRAARVDSYSVDSSMIKALL